MRFKGKFRATFHINTIEKNLEVISRWKYEQEKEPKFYRDGASNSFGQPGSHGPNRSINPLDVNFAALRADNLASMHRWRFITT